MIRLEIFSLIPNELMNFKIDFEKERSMSIDMSMSMKESIH